MNYQLICHNITVFSAPDLEITANALELLRKVAEKWEDIVQAWNTTYFARRDLIKQKPEGAAWQFDELPCLAEQRATALVYQLYH